MQSAHQNFLVFFFFQLQLFSASSRRTCWYRWHLGKLFGWVVGNLLEAAFLRGKICRVILCTQQCYRWRFGNYSSLRQFCTKKFIWHMPKPVRHKALFGKHLLSYFAFAVDLGCFLRPSISHANVIRPRGLRISQSSRSEPTTIDLCQSSRI